MKTILKYMLFLLPFSIFGQSEPEFEPMLVNTPKGVEVDAWELVGNDYTVYEMTIIDRQWLDGYGGVQMIANSTKRYNCHGYAWHNIEQPGTPPYISTIVWINDVNYSGAPINNVTKYYDYGDSGGKQSYCLTSNYIENLKVSYFPRDHSAVTTSDLNYFISKWAYGPLVRHKYDNCPFYPGATLKYYRLNPRITGSSSVMCGGVQRTFGHDLTHAPAAWNYSWNKTGDLSYVSGSTDTYTVQATSFGDGLATVRVNITTNSGHQSSAIKTLGVRYPGYSIISPESGSYLCDDEYYPIYADISNYFDVTSIDWYTYGMSVLFGQGTKEIYVLTDYYNIGSANVEVHYENACGNWTDYAIYFEDTRCSGYYILYPNPADNLVEIISKSSLEGTAKSLNQVNEPFETGTMRIFDSYGRVYSTIELLSDRQRITTSHLKDGAYILEIRTKSRSERIQFIIKH